MSDKIICNYCQAVRADMCTCNHTQYITAKMPFKKETIEDGTSCPYCDSGVIESTCATPDIDGNHITIDMVCCDCDREWIEHYRMYNVLPKGRQ